MQVRACYSPGRSHLSKHIPSFDHLPGLHADLAQVAVHRDESGSMIDEHRATVEEILTRVDNGPGGRRMNSSSGICSDVHAAVWIARLVVELASQAEGT